MGQVTRALLLLAVVVPVTAYVAGSLVSPEAPPPADHSPVILRDAPAEEPETPAPGQTSSGDRERQGTRGGQGGTEGGGDRQRDGSGRDGGDEARVVSPKPTPVGEDDDDERDDDGPDDDDTDDERTDGDD